MFSKIAFPLYILLISLLTFWLSRFPGHNGDMPFYIACAIEKEQGSMDAVEKQSLEFLRKELPVREYNDYAQRFSETGTGILDRYRVKPFYILLVLALHKMGFSYVFSTVLPSLISYFLIGVTIWRMTVLRLGPIRTFGVSLLAMIIFPTLELARLSTPDAISCLVLLNALFLIFDERKKTVWFSLFVFALFIRLDNFVSEMILLFALWKWPAESFKNKLTVKEFVGLAAILTCAALLVNGSSAHHFFWFRESQFALPPGQYWKDVYLYFYVLSGSFLIYLLILFVITGFSRGFSGQNELNYMFYAICGIVFARFILYPYYEERYLVPFLLFSYLIISFSVMRKKINGENALKHHTTAEAGKL
jgi:hypothetical protein